MDRICYTEEFKVLIEEFFKYRNKQWKVIQAVCIVLYLIFLLPSIVTKESPMWGILFFGQFAVFWLIFRMHQMKQRYEAGFFLTEWIEVMCFREFAVKKKKLNQQYIEQEIRKLLANFGNS